MAPAGTPDEVVRKVSDDLRAVLQDAEVRGRIERLGSTAKPLSPSETADFIRREQELWRPIVLKVGLARN
jgi:tripartite-type tricarboxylate transporter receptor subunit TctC